MTKVNPNRDSIPSKGYRIDFNKLCDNNDFCKLTNEYNKKDISELVRSIQDNELQVYVIRAIRLQKELERENDDDAYLDILEKRAILQSECSKTFQEAKILPEAPVAKGLCAREWGILAYYSSELQEIYYNGDGQKIELEVVKNVLSQMTGLSPSSFNNLCVPDLDNKADRRAMEKVATLINPILPDVSKRIREDLDDCGIAN